MRKLYLAIFYLLKYKTKDMDLYDIVEVIGENLCTKDEAILQRAIKEHSSLLEVKFP